MNKPTIQSPVNLTKSTWQPGLSLVFVFIVIALFLTSFTGISGCGNKAEKAKSELQTEEEVAKEDSVVFEMMGRDSITVLDILIENHTVDYKTSALGAFVLSIDSIEQSSSAFWLYSVNGEKPKIACDKKMTSDNDTIRWHFREVGQ